MCQDMVSVIDQDGDGDISFNEFVWLMTRSLQESLLTTVNSNICRDFNDGDIEDEIREALRMFDKEGNGFITSVGQSDN